MLIKENLGTKFHPQARSNGKTKPVRPDPQLLAELEQQRQSLIEKLEADVGGMAEGDVLEGDYADAARTTAAQSKRLALNRLWQNMLEEVERAISRIERGTYGLCERCGEVIPEERLVAMPSAALCIECARLQTQGVRVN
jgi:RNA polymerase-binding protein DksA